MKLRRNNQNKMSDDEYSTVDEVDHNDEDEEFIKVVEKEGADLLEVPKEDNNTVLVKTLKTQFADAIGLRYKGPTGTWRAVKEVDDALVPPKGGWGVVVYHITFHDNKRKANDSPYGGEPIKKFVKPSNPLLEDLVVLGLSFETTATELRTHIEEKYGELENCVINTEKGSGRSKGFGFVRFKEEEAAKAALDGETFLQGRKVFVKRKQVKPMKLFVNGLPDGTSQEDLNSYFSQFGTITDSHIPKDFKGFAFFTLSSGDDARHVLRHKHEYRGKVLKVRMRREPEQAESNTFGYGAPQRFPSGGRGGRGGGARGGGGSFGYQGYGMGNQGGGFQGNGGMNSSKKDELKNMLFQFLTS